VKFVASFFRVVVFSHRATETSPWLCGQIEVWSAQAPKPTLLAAQTRRESWRVNDHRWVRLNCRL